jgi:Luciferase-like monooxygenase
MADRLLRVGVLLDGATSPETVASWAVLAERAGLDGVWLAELGAPVVRDPHAAMGALAGAAEQTSTITLGAYLSQIPVLGAVPAQLAGRLQVTIPQNGLGHASRLTERTTQIVLVLDATRKGVIPPDVDGVVIQVGLLAAVTTDGRPAFPLAVELAASVGRTTAEALARIEADPRLRGGNDPRHGGLFGTLEDCQARVAELAEAGVSELRCWLPATPDVADVIAQLAAVAVGTLTPSESGRLSRPPAAPKGWGGRPRCP